ncbi:MAG TPA: hypothetical protein VF077_09765 [Nitrospiraceae bacterium]
MDVVWDQDVRTILSAIISREEVQVKLTNENVVTEREETIKSHVQLAIRYADTLAKAREALEGKKSHTPHTQFRRAGR